VAEKPTDGEAYPKTLSIERRDGSAFEARLGETKVFAELIMAISATVSETDVNFTEDGVRLQAMDSAETSFVIGTLPSSFFGELRCNHSMRIGVKLAPLNSALQAAAGKDSLVLTVDEDTHVLGLRFECPSRNELTIHDKQVLDPSGRARLQVSLVVWRL